MSSIFVFNKDFANNWVKGQEVICEAKPDNEFLVDGVALIPAKELLKYGEFKDESVPIVLETLETQSGLTTVKSNVSIVDDSVVLAKFRPKIDVCGNKSRDFHIGDIVRHFKGNLYEIMDFAIHTETGEKMVVYKALYKDENGERLTFVRPYDMFIEKVDKDKYPQATQEYRLEIVEVIKV